VGATAAKQTTLARRALAKRGAGGAKNIRAIPRVNSTATPTYRVANAIEAKAAAAHTCLDRETDDETAVAVMRRQHTATAMNNGSLYT